jgi:hypothetical protein
MRVRHGILVLRGFTDTDGIHYHRLCLTSLSRRLAAFFPNPDQIVNKSRRNASMDLLLNRILT